MFKKVFDFFKKNRLAVIVWGVILAVILINIIIAVNTSKKTATTTPSTNSPSPSGWAMQTGDYANNRWFGNGIDQIKSAETDAQASDALAVWLDRVKRDPILLAAAANSFLGKNITKDELVKDNWSTDLAIQSTMEIEMVIAKSKISNQSAPADGYNTGVNDGTVVTSKNPGVSGDRKAVQVTLPDDNKLWVMGRCGNITLPSKPSLPEGKTDNPTPPEQTKAPLPTPTPQPVVIVVTPKPSPTPTPKPTTSHHHSGGGSRGLESKSSDPTDYQRPGTDNTNDSGTGTMSPRPVVTSAPSTPAPVQTTRPSSNNRTNDSSNATPGSSSGATAPGASSGSSSDNAPAPRVVPPPAAPPANGGNNVNTGTPVNPF